MTQLTINEQHKQFYSKFHLSHLMMHTAALAGLAALAALEDFITFLKLQLFSSLKETLELAQLDLEIKCMKTDKSLVELLFLKF